jgi:hypothetical protein
MAAAADDILASEGPSSWWTMERHALPCPPGKLRLTPAGGYPHGRVPRSFQRTWWLAVADAALEQVREINEKERR